MHLMLIVQMTLQTNWVKGGIHAYGMLSRNMKFTDR